MEWDHRRNKAGSWLLGRRNMIEIKDRGPLALQWHAILCRHTSQYIGGIELVKVTIESELALDCRYLLFKVLNNASGYL